jgi:hypothetical protein
LKTSGRGKSGEKIMGLFSFTANKLKSRIREIIYRSSDRIEKAERDLQNAKSSLAKMQGVPGIEQRVVSTMEATVKAMEKTLADLRSNHARFAAENRKPSPAFPRGITV